METKTKKQKELFEINNQISYNRLTELETLLSSVHEKMEELYLKEFEGQKKLSKNINKALENLWDMRRDYDVKKLLTFKK